MAQRIQAKLRGWRKIGASRSVLNLLRHGHLVRWADLPPDPFHFSSRPLPPEETSWLLQEVVRGLGTGAWEPATSNQFCSAVFVVPKKNGGFRLVIDLRHLNDHVAPASCHYETLKDLPNMVHQSDWFFSIDLQDGFNCVPIAARHRKYFTFTVNFSNLPLADVIHLSEVHGLQSIPGHPHLFLLQMSALCFGYSASPLLFTKVMRQVVKFWRRKGVRCMPYVDDFLFMHHSRRAAATARALVRRTLELLGLIASEKKSHWELTQEIEHLGLLVDSRRGLFLVPPAKVQRLKSLASILTAHARTHRRWVSATRLFSKHIQQNLKTHQSNTIDAAMTKQLLYTVITHTTKTGIITHADKHLTTIWWHSGTISTLPTKFVTQHHNTMQRKARAQGTKFDIDIYKNILQIWQTAKVFDQHTNTTSWRQEWTPHSHPEIPIHTLAHTPLPRYANLETTRINANIPPEIQQTTIDAIEQILQKMTEHNDYDNNATISQNKTIQTQTRVRNRPQKYTPTHTPISMQKTTRRKRKQTEPKYKLGDEVHALFAGYERTTPCKITGILSNGYNVQASDGHTYSITYKEIKAQPTARQKPKTDKRPRNATKETKKRLIYENTETTAPTTMLEPEKKKHLPNSLAQPDSEGHTHKRKISPTNDQSSPPKQPRQGQG